MIDGLYFDQVMELVEDAHEFRREDCLMLLDVALYPHAKKEDQREIWNRFAGKKPKQFKPKTEAEVIEKLKREGTISGV